MSDPLVALDRVDVEYGPKGAGVRALSAVTCVVEAGERIAVVGPSGSGKSTLLHVMGGLDVPNRGSIEWPALASQGALRPTQVAFVFQAPSLLPALNVIENVAMPLLLAGVDCDLAMQRAREALRAFGLEDLERSLPEELSGGQAQRVAFSRAVAGRPRLLLADEPTGQLDRDTAREVLDVALQAIERISAALVVATHDAVVAQHLAKRWQMRHGTLEVAT